MSRELESGAVERLFEKKEPDEPYELPILRIAIGASIVVVAIILTVVCVIRIRHRDNTLENVIKRKRHR